MQKCRVTRRRRYLGSSDSKRVDEKEGAIPLAQLVRVSINTRIPSVSSEGQLSRIVVNSVAATSEYRRARARECRADYRSPSIKNPAHGAGFPEPSSAYLHARISLVSSERKVVKLFVILIMHIINYMQERPSHSNTPRGLPGYV